MNREKVQFGSVQVPEDKKNWMKHVTRDGTVFVTPVRRTNLMRGSALLTERRYDCAIGVF